MSFVCELMMGLCQLVVKWSKLGWRGWGPKSEPGAGMYGDPISHVLDRSHYADTRLEITNRLLIQDIS